MRYISVVIITIIILFNLDTKGFCQLFNLKKNRLDSFHVYKKKQLMYFEIDNIIDIKSDIYNIDSLIVKMNYGTIRREGSYFMVDYKGTHLCSEIDTIKFYKRTGDDICLVGFLQVECRNLPPPVKAIIGGCSSGTISKNKLLRQRIVTTSYGEYSYLFSFDYEVRIFSFTMSSMINRKLVKIKTKGNKISKEQLNLIFKLKKGSKLYIENIIAITPIRTKWNLPPIILEITE